MRRGRKVVELEKLFLRQTIINKIEIKIMKNSFCEDCEVVVAMRQDEVRWRKRVKHENVPGASIVQ